MSATALAFKLGAWAFTALAASLKTEAIDLASSLAEVAGKTVEFGDSPRDRPRDVVRTAAARLARQIDHEHRQWLVGEFRSDPAGLADVAGLVEALPHVLGDALSDLPALARADLDPTTIVDRAVTLTGRRDERFRPDTTGARLLRRLLAGAYATARQDADFARALSQAVDQALLERTTRLAAGQQRIEALLAAGGAHQLRLLSRHNRKQEPRNLRDLLMTERRATDLVGRQEELDALRMWLASSPEERDIAVHCVTGQAGSGKTRLAIELCEWAERAGWSAGFVNHRELISFQTSHHPSEWRWPRPTLVVVDYAAASWRVLRAWLEELAGGEAGPNEHPLRILLLERYADRAAGWWPDLIRPGSRSGPGPDALIDPQAPLPLHLLRAVEHRRGLLTQAMQLAARHLDRAAPLLPQPGEDALFDRRLADDAIDTEPLFLIMAGIVAVDRGAPTALALAGLDLAQYVADTERHRLHRVAQGAGADASLVLHLAACVTLQSGCDGDGAIRLIEQERAALGDRSLLRSDQLAALLRDALRPAEGDGIDAVRPDLIGEAFLLAELLPVGQQIATVERALHRAGLQVIATVIRTAQDHAQGAADHPGVQWLQHLAGLTDDPFALMAIAAALPEQTLALRESAAEITRRIITALATRVADDADLQPALAGWSSNLAVRLSELGKREAALDAAREAAELYRALAAQRPDAFRPNLAMSLNNLANRLSELGEREAALAAAREAAELYRALAAQRPDAFRPDLAMSLNNLANRLSELGEREAALDAAREAVELYRALAAQRPDAFRPDLAMSLNNLANRLSELGEREAALDAAREAVDIRRALAAQRPDAFRPDLAGSLNNLANSLSALGEREAALDAAREAVDIRRALAAQRPDAFRPDLAMSLNNLANSLSALGEREAALDAAREAVDIRRALAAQRPDAFRPDLAMSLNNLANRLSALGEREAALDAAREAADLYRALAAQRPDAFRPDLAMSLNNLANRLSELGEREAALDAAREAAELYHALAAQRPDAFRPDLAMSLNNLANGLSELGEHEAALDAAREAVEIRRTLAAQRPDAFAHNLAISLAVLANCLDAAQQTDAALAASIEAITALTGPFLRHRQAFAGLMGQMARDYLRRCEALGREPNAAMLAPVVSAFAELQGGDASADHPE